MVERRLAWLAGVVLLWGAAILYNIVSLQIFRHEELALRARARQEDSLEIDAPRGAIFDRSGQPLALSVPTYSVFVDPRKLDSSYASGVLARVLNLDRAALTAKLEDYKRRRRGFMWVKRRLEPQEWDALRTLRAGTPDLKWIGVEQESQRRYPNGALAAHVLGSVNFEEKGNWGLERSMDADLRGVPGRVTMLTDVKGRGIESQMLSAPRPGTSLTLSIDERLQHVAERELSAAVIRHQAASGSVVIMNPNNGDVLALASYPTFDPNRPPKPGEPARLRINNAVEAPFEPGSVFKVMTVAAALETTRLRPESIISCTPTITLFKRTIHEAHNRGYGAIPMSMVLAKSSNVGAVRVGLEVGPERMYDYVKRFGFGQRTGIPLPAESRGMLWPVNRWRATSLASISFGHEVTVTTIQLARAASVVANGGLLVKPRLILKKGSQSLPPEPPLRALKPETAITVRQMMEGVVLVGTGKRAALAGYSSGGKTGSAVIYDPVTKRYTHTYNGSYMGFAPVTNPAIVVVVTLNGTRGEGGYGGAASAPVFQVVATEALRVLEVVKDLPEQIAVAPTDPTVDEDAPPEVEVASGQPHVLETPADGPAQPAPEVPGPKTPNFQGMTVRAVFSQAAAKGLTVQRDGSGIARLQDPPPGAPLRAGEPIRVVFGR